MRDEGRNIEINFNFIYKRGVEFGGKFEGKELNRFKRVGKSRRGRVPDNRAIFKNGTNEGSIKSDEGGGRRVCIKVTKEKTKNFSCFAADVRNVDGPRKVRRKDNIKVTERSDTFDRKVGYREGRVRVKMRKSFMREKHVLRFR